MGKIQQAQARCQAAAATAQPPNSGSQLRLRPMACSMYCSRSSNWCSCLASVRICSRISCRQTWAGRGEQGRAGQGGRPSQAGLGDRNGLGPHNCPSPTPTTRPCTTRPPTQTPPTRPPTHPLNHPPTNPTLAAAHLFCGQVSLVQLFDLLLLSCLLLFLHDVILVFSIQLDNHKHHPHLQGRRGRQGRQGRPAIRPAWQAGNVHVAASHTAQQPAAAATR